VRLALRFLLAPPLGFGAFALDALLVQPSLLRRVDLSRDVLGSIGRRFPLRDDPPLFLQEWISQLLAALSASLAIAISAE
jgi:hypothetical protein